MGAGRGLDGADLLALLPRPLGHGHPSPLLERVHPRRSPRLTPLLPSLALSQALREELSEAKERAEDARAQLELATEEWREREGELATDVQRALNGSWWGLAKATRDALAAHQKRIDEAKAAVDQDGVVIGRALTAKDGAAEEAVEADAPLAEAQTPKPDAPAAEPVAAPAAVAAKPPPPKKNVFMI